MPRVHSRFLGRGSCALHGYIMPLQSAYLGKSIVYLKLQSDTTQQLKIFLPHHIFIQCKHSIQIIWHAHPAILKLKVEYLSYTFHPMNTTLVNPRAAKPAIYILLCSSSFLFTDTLTV